MRYTDSITILLYYFISGSLNGSLSSLAAHELGAVVIQESVKRAGISAGDVSEVILGHVCTAGKMIHHS